MSEAQTPAENFTISVTSTCDWPKSCEGVKPIVESIRLMIEAASRGQEKEFKSAKYDMEDAVWAWQTDLFGTPTREQK